MHINEPSTVMVDGRTMAYDEVSPPNPRGTILLLTGLASNRLGWFKQLEVFGRSYRTIALDHRGMGDSDDVAGMYRVEDMAEDAAAVLRALDIGQAHVIGISLGGFVALHLAARHPEMVGKLVLVSTSAGGKAHVWPSREIIALLTRLDATLESGERARRVYARIMAPGYAESHPDDCDEIAAVARYHSPSGDAYSRQFQAALAHDASAYLDGITAPTLVIHGELDPLVVAENGRHLEQSIAGARFILYPQVGHVPVIECAEQFNRDVLAFLES